jgi:hypothetical protein
MVAALRLLALVVAGALLAPVSTHAADAPPADSGLQSAKTEFEEAQALYAREKYGDAAVRFQSAYDKKAFPAFLFNAAVAFEKASSLPQAIEMFEKYLEKDPQAKDAPDVKTRIASLKAIAMPPPNAAGKPAAAAPAVLPAIATKGLVIIDSKPPGATIYLDDKRMGALGVTPWQGSLEPRPVKVIVESKGFKPEERSISPRTDKLYELYLALSEEHFLGWIEVTSNVVGAEVFLDKREVGAIGRTPYTGHAKPGKHTIWLQRVGFDLAKKEIDVQPGTANTYSINMDKVGVGWISVAGKESKGATVKLDGKVACKAPCQEQVAPGPHTIEVERDGMTTYRGELNVERASQMQVDVNFMPKPPRTKAWTAAVIAAVLVGGGTYAGLQANKIEKDLKRESNDASSFLDTNDPRVKRGRYWAIGADAAWGLGAVLGITSIIGFLSSGPDSTAEVDQRMVGLAPIGVPGGAGVGAAGRF